MAATLGRNHSSVSEFILVGFSTFPRHLLPAFFLLFLLMYLFTLLGNLLIMATVWSERSLHTPMYLFLCALSTSEILYTPNEIHHFLCHVPPLLKLACGTDVPVVAKGVGLVCIMALLGCCLLILLSYAFIVATILRIPSAEGRHKAFSTCASHLTVVIVHYGFASVVYLKPKGPQSLEKDTLMAITYTVLTPFLSPIIFSLRNKELKTAMTKTFLRKLHPSSI
ncbi:olfactory receptor 10H1-like [Puma concolor]|uniref:Olfactory receptor 10H1-like n=1 Tax=Puma concolor TaxID=9696 RepID=A0A6P6H7C5_PUMCO|nr:olfactory receptor 10H1-like [Puma concolor]